jgi:hypothetical protein
MRILFRSKGAAAAAQRWSGMFGVGVQAPVENWYTAAVAVPSPEEFVIPPATRTESSVTDSTVCERFMLTAR